MFKRAAKLVVAVDNKILHDEENTFSPKKGSHLSCVTVESKRAKHWKWISSF